MNNGGETAINSAVMRFVDFVSHKCELGAIISYGDIMGMLGVEDKKVLYQVVGKARKELMRRDGIFLDTITKVGYKVMTPGEEINRCLALTIKGMRMEIVAAGNSLMIRSERITDPVAKQRTIALSQQLTARVPFADNQLKALEAITTQEA